MLVDLSRSVTQGHTWVTLSLTVTLTQHTLAVLVAFERVVNTTSQLLAHGPELGYYVRIATDATANHVLDRTSYTYQPHARRVPLTSALLILATQSLTPWQVGAPRILLLKLPSRSPTPVLQQQSQGH